MPSDSGDDTLRVSARVSELPGSRPRRSKARGSVLRYLRGAVRSIRHGFPATLLFLAASQIVEDFEPLAFVNAEVTRAVIARRTPGQDELRVHDDEKKPGPTLQQLEIGAPLRVASFEQRDAGSEVNRVGGVAPIRRGEMARVLSALAGRLPAFDPAQPRTVAIDVDLAPLGAGATSEAEETAMNEAIEALRQRAHVVAIVLDRNTDGDIERRDKFMARHCSRLVGPTNAAVGGVFFASPRLFHRVGEYPLTFPAQRLDSKHAAAGDWPQWFPSLGNLMHLLRQPEALGNLERKRSLTLMCEQVHANLAAARRHPLLEDGFQAQTAALLQAYDAERFNWRLLDSTAMRYSVIDSVEAIGQRESLEDRLFKPAVLLLSIDGGGRHDKFDIAGISPEPVSGATLHGLQAQSLDLPLEERQWQGALIDFAIGLSFAFLWALVSPGLRSLRGIMPIAGSWLSALTPPLLAYGVMCASLQVAAWLTSFDIWINPAYIILGLAIDTYLEGWRQEAEARGADASIAQGLRYAFGVDTAWSALQRGFGDRVHRMEVAVDTQRSEFDLSADVRSHGAGGAYMTDQLVSALVKVVVLAWGGVLLAMKFT